MPVYSFSKINVFQQCELRFRYKYIDKYPDHDRKGIDLLLGSVVHETLQYLYTRLNVFHTPSLDECIQYFDTLWARDYHEGILCPADKSLEDYKHRGHTYIQHYYQTYHPFDQEKTISLEDKSFSFELQQGIKFTGVIDRLAAQGQDFIIIDYKTGQKLPTMQQDEYREQMTLYAHGVKQKYERYQQQISARLMYLHFDIQDSWIITDQEIDEVVNKYSSLIASIQDKATRYGFGDTQAFVPQQGAHCKFCPYQSICPLFNHLGAEDIVVQDTTIRKLIDQYVEQSQEISKLEYSKEQKRNLILQYLKQFPTAKLYGNQHRISIYKTSGYKIQDEEGLNLILKQLGLLDQVLKIDPHRLTTLIKEDKIQTSRLQETITHKESIVLRSSK